MIKRAIPLILSVFLCAALLFAGCSFRPDSAAEPDRSASVTPEPTPVATPAPTEAIYHSVSFMMGDVLLQEESVLQGSHPSQLPIPEGRRLIGWTDGEGTGADPLQAVIEKDTVFFAETRPVLNGDADILFPNELGLLTPESPFTKGDAAKAVRALLPDTGEVSVLLSLWAEEPNDPLSEEAFRSLLETLFAPEEVESVWAEVFVPDTGADGEAPEAEPEETSRFTLFSSKLTRARAAFALWRLLGSPERNGDSYYPDVSPARADAAALLSCAQRGTLTAEDLLAGAKDGFIWLNGYLYLPDENGYFVTDETVDSLYFDPNGRYTSGNEELDGYVADTIREFMVPEQPRLEDLRALYLHVKNDFSYLVRNIYESGATGWDIEEALTMFRTGKGNCYCFTGAFCSLARGMGYNARTWSGTMGTRNQPHSWTEITLDDQIYICDPEIELNYWLLEMYTDNFMMRKEDSGGWNYLAVGRPGI